MLAGKLVPPYCSMKLLGVTKTNMCGLCKNAISVFCSSTDTRE